MVLTQARGKQIQPASAQNVSGANIKKSGMYQADTTGISNLSCDDILTEKQKHSKWGHIFFGVPTTVAPVERPSSVMPVNTDSLHKLALNHPI